jgi:hypothetical protein
MSFRDGYRSRLPGRAISLPMMSTIIVAVSAFPS